MKNIFKIVFSIFGLLLLATSCGVNSNVMFKEAKGAEVKDSIPLTPVEDYRISVDDKISFNLYTNDGKRIVESLTGIEEQSRWSRLETEYLVRNDGTAKLPIIGYVHVEGLTVEECEDTLAKMYSAQYNSPFVQVRITNQRVIVFPGNGSDAKVIPLINTNTTLMEALAQAGGITERGKASKVKLMRKINGERVIYVIDLSTVDGLKYVDMVVQANDYIYVEPTPDLSKEIAEDVLPVVSILSGALIVFSVVNLLK